MTYKIIRGFRDRDMSVIIATNRTLKQARAHCKGPETSSSTCTTDEGLALTKEYGPWFDGYEREWE